MAKNKCIIFILSLLLAGNILAQKEERRFIRKGNRAFNDSVFVNAEINYRKALEINPQSTISMYNLGNALSQQQNFKDAMEQYVAAADIEKDKMKLAKIYHNAGVIFQAAKEYAKAIEVYKKALRNNPKDDETRYNLALAQKLLKDQEQNQQDQQDNQQDQDQQQEQKQEKEQEQNQNQEQNQDQKQQESKPEENEMSKENAEQMLNSVMQDEKDVQEKVKKQQQIIQSGHLEKDW